MKKDYQVSKVRSLCHVEATIQEQDPKALSWVDKLSYCNHLEGPGYLKHQPLDTYIWLNTSISNEPWTFGLICQSSFFLD